MKKFITLITIMLFTTLIGLCGCAGDYRKTVTSIEAMTLTLQGMRGTSVYEIAEVDGKTELRRFRKCIQTEKISLNLKQVRLVIQKISLSL